MFSYYRYTFLVETWTKKSRVFAPKYTPRKKYFSTSSDISNSPRLMHIRFILSHKYHPCRKNIYNGVSRETEKLYIRIYFQLKFFKRTVIQPTKALMKGYWTTTNKQCDINLLWTQITRNLRPLQYKSRHVIVKFVSHIVNHITCRCFFKAGFPATSMVFSVRIFDPNHSKYLIPIIHVPAITNDCFRY